MLNITKSTTIAASIEEVAAYLRAGGDQALKASLPPVKIPAFRVGDAVRLDTITRRIAWGDDHEDVPHSRAIAVVESATVEDPDTCQPGYKVRWLRPDGGVAQAYAHEHQIVALVEPAPLPPFADEHAMREQEKDRASF